MSDLPRVEQPAPEADQPAWGKVGIIAFLSFAVGVAWPRRAGVSLGPNPPADAPRAAPASSVAAAARTSLAATAPLVVPTGSGVVAPTPGGETNEQGVTVSAGELQKCRDPKGKATETCDKIALDPIVTPRLKELSKCPSALGLTGKQVGAFQKLVTALYTAYIDLDGAIIEINPVVVTKAGDVLALDAKVSFDDSALFRHKDLEALRDDTEMDPKELDAVNHDLNYVALDGEIGCMVNGAGLAMATMDITKLYGSSPANFLDVGGTADAARVTEAFRIITSDTNVKGILVNIFGGIAKCDMIANGIVAASKNLDLKVPLVVRLEGTNVELGKKILAESGLAIIPADNLADAAQKAVAAVRNA